MTFHYSWGYGFLLTILPWTVNGSALINLLQYAEQMQAQIKDALANLIQTRKALLNSDGLTEANYSKLEMSANRYFELLKGRQHKAIRYIGEKALPTKSISLPDWIVPELTQQQLKTALNELDNYEN